ncbi:hypothetical protein MHYP_G00245250 [Metynnis hypsauchen]
MLESLSGAEETGAPVLKLKGRGRGFQQQLKRKKPGFLTHPYSSITPALLRQDWLRVHTADSNVLWGHGGGFYLKAGLGESPLSLEQIRKELLHFCKLLVEKREAGFIRS